MNLGKVLKDWRWANKMSMRDAGKIWGLGAATVMRLEQGHDPDAKTFKKIFIWLLSEQNHRPAVSPKP